MSDFGPKRKGTAPRGRPKKKPDYNREKEIDGLVQQAAKLFAVPYDDRDERHPDLPSINSVAIAMNISRLKARKLLITAEYYSSAASREAQRLFESGCSVDEICQKMSLVRQTVNSLLPYRRGVYNLEDPPLFAENCRMFRKRKQACERLTEHMDETDCCRFLWEAVEAFEQYPFQMGDGGRIKYSIDCDRICFGDKTFCRAEIEDAYYRIRKIQRDEGSVGRKNCQCCDELYTVFLRIGACNG